ncbi:MAG: hypothetical protein QNJ91_06065 [Gammaproteobacteria bacterium]|nr:hypothetical protein [Gammaproteobacteria bacterium]
MTQRLSETLLALLLGVTIALPALAGPDRRKSLDEAVSDARDRYNGRVLSAETQRRNGRESHRIRILTDDGRVKRLNIDAESGHSERKRRK